jgi:hypothetical protein
MNSSLSLRVRGLQSSDHSGVSTEQDRWEGPPIMSLKSHAEYNILDYHS